MNNSTTKGVNNIKDVEVLHEFVSLARERLSDGSWDYIIGATETETTALRNRHALDTIAFRPRVLCDVSSVDASTTFLGHKLRLPLVTAPIGSLQDFDPGAGATVARACAEFGVMHVQSSACQPGMLATAQAADGPKTFQLYVRGDRPWLTDQVNAASEAGYEAFCVTVDTAHYSRRERDLAKRYVTSGRKQVSGQFHQAALSWNDIDHVRSLWNGPLMLKGIATSEDARLCVEHGIDVVWVSNHGGRQLDHGLGSLAVLPEVVEAVDGAARIIVDGAISRGTDVVKAICLGADAVGIGRLLAYALSAGGQAGVVHMLELLEREVEICLGLVGVTSLDQLGPRHVVAAPAVTRSSVLSPFPLLEEGY